MEFLLLTGMSGAGKNTALSILEDFDYYCVDNLPVQLLHSFLDLTDLSAAGHQKVAVAIDIRNGESLELLQDILDSIDRQELNFKILFLDAEDEVLIKRYKETRRSHPLAGTDRVGGGILLEREALAFLKERADYIIDTSHLLVRDLRAEMQRIFVDQQEYKSLFVTVLSFGYKYGIPEDADLVFDVRFLPNPYYLPDLRPLTGNDQAIQDYVLQYEEAHIFLDKLEDMIRFLIPNYITEGKNQLVIGIGCTGGKHRSVTLANQLYDRLKGGDSYGIKIEHRDITKDAQRGK